MYGTTGTFDLQSLTSRKEFELWYSVKCGYDFSVKNYEGEPYPITHAQWAWIAWQASRECMGVKS